MYSTPGRSRTSGSQATQKKVYLGKGAHYFPKSGIAEFAIEAYDLKKGDKILITGPSTGARETIVEELYVDELPAEKADKGKSCTLRLPFRVRTSDKLYKLVEA